MNILRRLFNGRVAKPRQTAAGKEEGSAPHSSPRSAISSRQARSPSSRAGSGVHSSSRAQCNPTKHRRPYPRAASAILKVRIKNEDEEDGTLTMAPPDFDDLDVVANCSQINGADDEMDTEYPPEEARSPQVSLEAEPSEGDCSILEELAENEEEGTGEDEAEENASESGYIFTYDNDEALPSIEDYEGGGDEGDDEQDEEDDDQDEDDHDEDDRNEGDQDDGKEEELYQPRERTPIYLHGTTHRPKTAPENEAGEGVGRKYHEMDDDAFEEELKGERERGLLINEDDLRYWLHHKRATDGIDTWPTEARRLYKLLFLRGSYPMFCSDWTRDFSQEPVPRALFTPRESDHFCLLQPEREKHRASTALRKLFVVHIGVGNLRKQGTDEKINRIAPVIKRELELYVRWAESDIGFRRKRDYMSPIFIVAKKTPQEASTGRSIVEQCRRLVDTYKAWYAQRGIQEYARCIYIFVIVQHVVLVMVADTESGDGEEPYPVAELDLSQRSHWLDYSLAISITVILAKDALAAHRASCPEIEWESDDIDA